MLRIVNRYVVKFIFFDSMISICRSGGEVKMIFWSLVGITGWVLCVLFMLAIIKGGHRVRGNERKLYSRYRVNTQKKVMESIG